VRLSFSPELRVEFPGATVTSDAGLLLLRELDERLDLIERKGPEGGRRGVGRSWRGCLCGGVGTGGAPRSTRGQQGRKLENPHRKSRLRQRHPWWHPWRRDFAERNVSFEQPPLCQDE
jgi:hypothetical protein